MTTSLATQIRDDEFLNQVKYFDEVRNEQALLSVWSIHEVKDINAECPTKVAGKKVVYETICKNATNEDLLLDIQDGGKRASVQYTMFVGGNTWLDLWKAAESVISQSGTHHRYIEDFQINTDGTIELTTGS
jgi:hypothetical protein